MRFKCFALLVLIATPLLSQTTTMDDLIRKAHGDRNEIPALVKSLMSGHVVIIASWDDLQGTTINVQDFVLDGQSYIPIFSSEAQFKSEFAGTEFEKKGVSIDANLFATLLHDADVLVLNPQSAAPVKLTAQDLKAAVDPSRLPKP